MSWRENLKKLLNDAEATNPAKLYTPFTLFTTFFVLYFNAELFGSIFLADQWNVQKEALSKLGERSFGEWAGFVTKVFGSAVLLTIAYGLTSAIASFFWGLTSLLSVHFVKWSNKKNYISMSTYNEKLTRINKLELSEKDLYQRLSQYHTWKPEDIDRLTNDVKKRDDDISKLHDQTTSLTTKLTQATNAKDNCISTINFLIEYRRVILTLQSFNSAAEAASEWIRKDELFVVIEGLDIRSNIQSLVEDEEKEFLITVGDLNQISARFLAFIDFYELGESHSYSLEFSSIQGNNKAYEVKLLNDEHIRMLSNITGNEFRKIRSMTNTTNPRYKRIKTFLDTNTIKTMFPIEEKSLLHEYLGPSLADSIFIKRIQLGA
jgi:hypothetical protein